MHTDRGDAMRTQFVILTNGILTTQKLPRTDGQANDDYLSNKIGDFHKHKIHERELTPEELLEKQLESNFRIMKQIRERVDGIVEDPKTAAALKPYYPYFCKRPTFHDEYL